MPRLGFHPIVLHPTLDQLYNVYTKSLVETAGPSSRLWDNPFVDTSCPFLKTSPDTCSGDSLRPFLTLFRFSAVVTGQRREEVSVSGEVVPEELRNQCLGQKEETGVDPGYVTRLL